MALDCGANAERLRFAACHKERTVISNAHRHRAWTAVPVFVACLAFRFAQATPVSGHITDADTQAPIAGASFSGFILFNPNYSFITTTDAQGFYQVDLPDGNTYDVEASADGYVTLFDSITPNGTPVVADFVLYAGASIQGTVRQAADNSALAGANVTLLNADTAAFLGQSETDAAGNYAFGPLNPGNYAICVIDHDDLYLDTCYEQMTTGADGVPVFTAIALTAGQSATAIDITLSGGATITGTLRDGYDNALIAGAPMDFQFYSAQKKPIFTASTVSEPDGSYAIHGLAPGNYYISAGYGFDRTANSLYRSRFHGCASGECTIDAAASVDVQPGGAGGIDFAPYPGFIVTGKVTDALTNAGIPGVTVESCEYYYFFFDAISGSTVTDANGDYVLKHVIGTQASSPHVATIDAPGYFNLAWVQTAVTPVSFCTSPPAGNPIAGFTTPDQPVGQIDFALQKGAAISGTIRADIPGVTLRGFIRLFSFDGQTEHLISQSDSADDGTYTTIGLPAGTYYIVAYSADPGACALYGDGSCDGPGGLDNAYAIDFGNGTPIILTESQVQGGIDVHLPVRIFASGFE